MVTQRISVREVCDCINYMSAVGDFGSLAFSSDTLVSINKVTVHQARLVLGWVTQCGKIYLSI